jgi:hypothetical protein
MQFACVALEGCGPVKKGAENGVDDALVELGNLWAGESGLTIGVFERECS